MARIRQRLKDRALELPHLAMAATPGGQVVLRSNVSPDVLCPFTTGARRHDALRTRLTEPSWKRQVSQPQLVARPAGVVFLDRSLSEVERVAKDRRGYFRYDLFMIEGGVTSQVTKLESYMSFVAIPYDGSTAAFGTKAS
jgi:hypothetical protein